MDSFSCSWTGGEARFGVLISRWISATRTRRRTNPPAHHEARCDLFFVFGWLEQPSGSVPPPFRVVTLFRTPNSDKICSTTLQVAGESNESMGWLRQPGMSRERAGDKSPTAVLRIQDSLLLCCCSNPLHVPVLFVCLPVCSISVGLFPTKRLFVSHTADTSTS